MADDTDNGDNLDPEAETTRKVPIRRVIVSSVIFALWSAVVSTIHAFFTTQFDVTSVVVAEVGMLPILLLMVKQLNLKWGDKSLDVIPAEVETTRKMEKAFKETETIVVPTVSGEESHTTVTPSVRTGAEVKRTITEVRLSETESDARSWPEELPARPPTVAFVDDGSVLVRLRAELELRLRALAKMFGVPVNARTNSQLLLAGLTGKGVISSNEARGIVELIKLGNDQLHGLPLSAAAAEFARTEGERLLIALDELPMRLHRELLATVTERAPSVLTPMMGEVDLIVDSDVAVEVKPSGSATNVTKGISQVDHYMRTANLPKGLVLFGTAPSAETMPHDDPASIGLAWRTARGEFGGTDNAKHIAPWLFSKQEREI